MNLDNIILLHLLFLILNPVTLLPLQSLADQLTNSSESTTVVINSTTLLSTEVTTLSGNFTVTDSITTTTDFLFNLTTTNGCGVNTTTVSGDTDVNETGNSLVIAWDASRRVPNYVVMLLFIFMISVLLTIAGLVYNGCQLRRVKKVPESRVISSRTARVHEPIQRYKSFDDQRI